MKRILFSHVLLFTFVAIHAQVNIEKVPDIKLWDFETIPSFFCNGEKTIMVSREYNSEEGFGYYDCYDSSLNQICHFKINEEKFHIRSTPFVDYDTNFGKPEPGHIVRYFHITQTLFNDDDKFEFLADIYSNPENPYLRDICICNEDGDILQKLDIEGHIYDRIEYLIKLNGEYYFVVYEDGQHGYSLYKITKGAQTGSKALNITKTSNTTPRYYDLNGSSVNPDATKGQIIIKTNGTTSEKVLIK